MGQVIIRGEKRKDFLETLVVADLQLLEENQATLSLLTNEDGGIIDDCIITNKPDHIFIVVNGACKRGDIEHMTKHLHKYNQENNTDITLEEVSDRSLLALQGIYIFHYFTTFIIILIYRIKVKIDMNMIL